MREVLTQDVLSLDREAATGAGDERAVARARRQMVLLAEVAGGVSDRAHAR